MTKPMPAEPHWLSVPTAGRRVGVDREHRSILGYVVAQEGPFKSAGRGEFDRQALNTIVDLMRSEPQGLKSRFAHPDMSSDGLGKFLGRAVNPRLDAVSVRRDGQAVQLACVRADLQLSATAFSSPNGNLGQYVLDLAEEDPDALSSSLVLKTDKEPRLGHDGGDRIGDDGEPLPPLWRPTQLHASDIVDTGEAVDGLLSAQLAAGELPDEALRRGSELLDRVFAGQPREAVEARCRAYLERYLSRRFGEPWRPSIGDRRRRLALREKSFDGRPNVT